MVSLCFAYNLCLFTTFLLNIHNINIPFIENHNLRSDLYNFLNLVVLVVCFNFTYFNYIYCWEYSIHWVFFFVKCFLEIGTNYINLTVQEFSMKMRLTLNSQMSRCHSILHTRIKVLSQQSWMFLSYSYRVVEVLKVGACVWLQVHREARSNHIPPDSYNMLWAIQTGCWYWSWVYWKSSKPS